MSNKKIFNTNQEKTSMKNINSALNTSKKHNSIYNQTTQNSTSHNNRTSNNNSNFTDWKNNNFCALVRQAFWEEEEYLRDKTLIPNTQNYEKYLYVKKQLNKICKWHDTKLYEEPQTTSAYFTLKLYVLDTAEILILSKITHLCSAVSIDANLDGQLEIGVTIPDVRCVFE